MSVRSINYNISSSYGAYNQKLTQSTRMKLDELGLSYTSTTTEAEARQMIRAYESEKNEQKQQGSLFDHKSSDSLFERAKDLASRLGIPVDEKTDIKNLLIIIEQKLEQKIASSSNNIDEIKLLKSMSQELASIQAQSRGSSGYDNTNQALMMSLEMLSEYNKNFLNK